MSGNKAQKNRTNILILHGWGLRGDRYEKLQKRLEELGYTVLSPDFPGFGSEKLKKSSYALDDYVTFLDNYITKNKLDDCILIGHSFGGRVITKYLANNPTNKIKGVIFTGTPLVRVPLSLRQRVGVMGSKIGKTIVPETIRKNRTIRKYIYRFIGEMDYYKSGDLRDTFVQIVSEDLEHLLQKIMVPTLIIWGENDTITPLRTGIAIQQRVKGAKLISVPNETHKLPYDNPLVFAKYVDAFSKNLS